MSLIRQGNLNKTIQFRTRIFG